MVGRAGVGLDNVDVDAATARGVMVVNAPTSNILSVAEQAMALLLAQARNIPQAHAALVAGRWERSKWEGVELHGKVLGVVGLGRAGSLVAQRAHAFGMELIGFDPFVVPGAGPGHGRALVSIEELVGEADFVSIHTPKTPETIGLFGRDLLAKAKPGIRIVNTARGGIVDEEALAEAIRDGDRGRRRPRRVRQGALHRVTAVRAAPVVVSPHLGASTEEAQDKAGVTIAEQVLLALAGDFVPYAVNVAAARRLGRGAPFMALAEQLGRFFGACTTGCPTGSRSSTRASWPRRAPGILTLSALKGIFAGSTEEPVSYVNAPQLAERTGPRGARDPDRDVARLQVASSPCARRRTRSPARSARPGCTPSPASSWSTTTRSRSRRRTHMLVVRNDDRPGVIGIVGTALGTAGHLHLVHGGGAEPRMRRRP